LVVVCVPVGGAPVAVGVVSGVVPVLAVWVAVWVAVRVVAGAVVWAVAGGDAVGDLLADADDPHPTGVTSSASHKRTARSLTFAG
jgi:hypothetical protein